MPAITQDSNRTITAPGAYWLEQDVAWMDGGYGLQIAASNVTVNLNGHYLGNNGPVAIYASGQHDVEIANGHIWGGSIYGVRIEGYVSNNRVSGLDVYGQQIVGVSVEGYGNTIVDNNTIHNIGTGYNDRSYDIISGGNGNVIAYNLMYGSNAVNETVGYSDAGFSHQIFGNHFYNWDDSADNVYFIWDNAVGDDIWSNLFSGQYRDDTFGIYSQDTPDIIGNIVYNILQEDFYLLPGDPCLYTQDEFFWI